MTHCPYCQQQHESEEINGCRELWILHFSDLLERMTGEEWAEFARDLRAELDRVDIRFVRVEDDQPADFTIDPGQCPLL